MYLLYLEEEETKMKVDNKIKELALEYLKEQYVAEAEYGNMDLVKAIEYTLNLVEGDLDD